MLTHIQIKVAGYVLIAIGVVIKYIIRRRKFNRRAITGMELFTSFEAAWITRLVEGLFNLIALFLILGGLGMLLMIGQYLK